MTLCSCFSYLPLFGLKWVRMQYWWQLSHGWEQIATLSPEALTSTYGSILLQLIQLEPEENRKQVRNRKKKSVNINAFMPTHFPAVPSWKKFCRPPLKLKKATLTQTKNTVYALLPGTASLTNHQFLVSPRFWSFHKTHPWAHAGGCRVWGMLCKSYGRDHLIKTSAERIFCLLASLFYPAASLFEHDIYFGWWLSVSLERTELFILATRQLNL